MNFKFSIYDGIEEEDGTSTASGAESNEQAALEKGAPDAPSSFIPRTPESSKIQRGERGALVQKMVSALRAQVQDIRENFPDSGSVVGGSDSQTDLQSIDSEIREILNSFGIFFFRQIPQHIITTYGSLLSSRGEDESHQRLIETNLSNEDYFDTKAEQAPLLSQDEIA